MGDGTKGPLGGLEWLSWVLKGWRDDEPEYHLILAQVFFVLAAKAQRRAWELRRGHG